MIKSEFIVEVAIPETIQEIYYTREYAHKIMNAVFNSISYGTERYNDDTPYEWAKFGSLEEAENCENKILETFAELSDKFGKSN